MKIHPTGCRQLRTELISIAYFMFAPTMIDESQENSQQYYQVEKILDVKEQNGRKYYLVKWLNWDIKTCTWQQEKHISHLKPLIREFYNSRKFDQQNNIEIKKMEKVEVGMSPYEETKVHGHVLYGDEPERILEVTVIQKNGIKTVHFLVQWKERQDKYKPYQSLIQSKILIDHYPHFVVKFYESKIQLIVQS